MGYWVKKKKGKKRKEKKTTNDIVEHINGVSPASRKTSPDRPLSIQKSHTILLCPTSIQFNSTYLFLHARSSSCLGAGDTRSGSPSQQGYRHVGLHERVPLDSHKSRRSIIQPRHPANLNAAAPSFQSKMLSGSARLWRSACSLSLCRSQSRKRSQGETVAEDHPRSTSRCDGINQGTWNEHHKRTLPSHENMDEYLASG